MKGFWRTVLAVVFGMFLYSLLMWIFWILILVNISMMSTFSPPKIKEGSVLVLKLNKPIQDKVVLEPGALGALNGQKNPLGLNDIVKAIQYASTNPMIKGILLDTRFVMADWSQTEEIRQALEEFRQSGKFIVAFSDFYNSKNYYLSTVANKIYIVPTGTFQWKGLGTEIFFYKKLFSKLGIEPILIRHGKYKSAGEPFVRDSISQPNRQQLQLLLKRIWNQVVTAVSQSRNLDEKSLNNLASNLAIRVSSDAQKYGLVDGQIYYDQLLDTLKELAGLLPAQKLHLLSLSDYIQNIQKIKITPSPNKIAIIYAQGQIVDAKTGLANNEIVASQLTKLLRKARKNSSIKAVVLRVNSPGGSALAAEEIWREAKLLAETKPLIVSMGGLAASGGYYISSAADKIVADSMTITGSIGVFGLLFNAQNLIQNKIGITHSIVATNRNAYFNPVTNGLTPEQREYIKVQIDTIYQTFLRRVAEGRRMTVAQVDSIAQGRVWSAIDAKKIGLVDTLGNLQTAIDLAVEQSGVLEYQIVEYPRTKTLLEVLLNPGNLTQVLFKKHFDSEIYQQLQYIESLVKQNTQSKIYTLFPFKLKIF